MVVKLLRAGVIPATVRDTPFEVAPLAAFSIETV